MLYYTTLSPAIESAHQRTVSCVIIIADLQYLYDGVSKQMFHTSYCMFQICSVDRRHCHPALHQTEAY